MVIKPPRVTEALGALDTLDLLLDEIDEQTRRRAKHTRPLEECPDDDHPPRRRP